MSAELVPIESNTSTPSKGEQRLREACWNATNEFREWLIREGVITYGSGTTNQAGELFKKMATGASDLEYHLIRRAKAVERTLQFALASTNLSAAERERLLTVLHGRQGVGRIPRFCLSMSAR